MDLRIQRTRANIHSAFIELRSRKPIEKITIKELSELAFINKATFYQHYHDIYDLAESMEDDLIDNIIGSIPHPDTLLDQPGRATVEIFQAFQSQTRLLYILFSGSRRSVLVTKIEERIRDLVMRSHPEYAQCEEKEILLTFAIQGSFHAFLKHGGQEPERVIRTIAGYTQKMGAPDGNNILPPSSSGG